MRLLLIISLLIPFVIRAQDTLPELNQKIVQYVEQNKGKKVGRGECWDLAAQILDRENAQWDHRFVFGTKINSDNSIIFPGDIIQFKGVKTSTGLKAIQHTAIIYKINADGKFIVAEQNANGKRKVMFNEFDRKTIIKGQIFIYRPVQ